MERAGVLHRDVSVGNILIVDKPDASAKFCGFLHDFDCSATNVTADLPPSEPASERDEDASDYSSEDDDEDAASQTEEISMRQDLKKRAVSRRYN